MDEHRGIWRGKRVDNGELVQGFYSCVTDNYTPKNIYNITTFRTLDNGEVILTGTYEVAPSTLGECTGLHDKNSKLIFEGDICKDDNTGSVYVIIWDKYQWECKTIKSDYVLILDCAFPLWQWDNCKENGYRTLEVIGNIHDNLDLLKGADI